LGGIKCRLVLEEAEEEAGDLGGLARECHPPVVFARIVVKQFPISRLSRVSR